MCALCRRERTTRTRPQTMARVARRARPPQGAGGDGDGYTGPGAGAGWFVMIGTTMMMTMRITTMEPMTRFIFAFCTHMCFFVARAVLWNLRRRGAALGEEEACGGAARAPTPPWSGRLPRCRCAASGSALRAAKRSMEWAVHERARLRLVGELKALILQHLRLVDVRQHHLHVLRPAARTRCAHESLALTRRCSGGGERGARRGAGWSETHMTVRTPSTCRCTSSTRYVGCWAAIGAAAAGKPLCCLLGPAWRSLAVALLRARTAPRRVHKDVQSRGCGE